MNEWAKAAVAVVVGFLGMLFGIFIIIMAIVAVGTAFAQEVEPTRDARLSDYDNPDYKPIAESEIRTIDLGAEIWIDDGVESRVLTCTEYNDAVIAQVIVIAGQIIRDPGRGTLYRSTILFWYGELNEDCL